MGAAVMHFPERPWALLLALSGLVFGSATLMLGYWQADDIELERKLCRKLGVCATGTLKAAARNLLWSGEPGAAADAVTLYSEALTGEPVEPENWAGLGEALAEAGIVDDAEKAYRTAIALGPNRPEILMRAANWAFANGQIDLAVELTHRILSIVRDYDRVLFRFLRLSGISIEETLERAVPDQREALASYLRDVVAANGSGAARMVWDRMQSLGYVERTDLASFTGSLLGDGLASEAAEAQRGFIGEREPGWPTENAVFNPVFEEVSLGGPLDWSIRPHKSVSVTMDKAQKTEGDQSLKIEFLGTENLLYNHVSQTLVLEPGLEYSLSAMARADGVTTEEGLRLQLRRPDNRNAIIAETDSIRRTSDWTRIEQRFLCPPDTNALELTLVRRRSSALRGMIRGFVWIDDVRVSPAR